MRYNVGHPALWHAWLDVCAEDITILIEDIVGLPRAAVEQYRGKEASADARLLGLSFTGCPS